MSEPYEPKPIQYDATSPERLAQIDRLASIIMSLDAEQLAPSEWEDTDIRDEEGLEFTPDWKTVSNPWDNGAVMEAAAIISEDPEYGTRSFSIARRNSDAQIDILASFYRVTSDRLLMMPADRVAAETYFTLIPWEGEEADKFFAVTDQLFPPA